MFETLMDQTHTPTIKDVWKMQNIYLIYTTGCGLSLIVLIYLKDIQ